MKKLFKKPFKETKLFGLLKGTSKVAINAALDVLPIPDPRKYFDKNQDGKIDMTDLSKVKWSELAIAVGLCAALLHFNIISMDELITIIRTLLNLNQ